MDEPSTVSVAMVYPEFGVIVKVCVSPWVTEVTPGGATVPLLPAEAVIV